jgi:uncharacterized protein
MVFSREFFKKILPVILIFLVIGYFAYGCHRNMSDLPEPEHIFVPTTYNTLITVGTHSLTVEVVNNDATRAQGLSGRERLQDDQGMLFDMRNTNIDRPSFWMKDMRFGLDLIWIKNNRVVGITKNVPAPTENTSTTSLPTYPPPAPVDMVLEVNAGWAEIHNLKVGDAVEIK